MTDDDVDAKATHCPARECDRHEEKGLQCDSGERRVPSMRTSLRLLEACCLLVTVSAAWPDNVHCGWRKQSKYKRRAVSRLTVPSPEGEKEASRRQKEEQGHASRRELEKGMMG